MIKNKIDKLIATINCDQYNITTYNLEEVNVSAVIQDALTPPFLSKNKVIIMKRPTFLTTSKVEINHNLTMFSDFLDNPLESTYLIIDASGLVLNEKNENVKKLKAKAEISDTKELDQVQTRGWLKRQFEVSRVDISDEAVDLFLDRVGNNLVNAKNEVDKLLNFIFPNKVIKKSDVAKVVTEEGEQDAFRLTNAIIDKNKEKIITVYHELLTNGKEPMQLLAMVSRSMMDILVASKLIAKGYSNNDIAQMMNISSGRAYYLVKNAKAFKLKVIEEMIDQLATLDLKVKSGQIDPMTGLELFIFGLEK